MLPFLAHAFHDVDAFAVPAPLAALCAAAVLMALAAAAHRWWTEPPLAMALTTRSLPEWTRRPTRWAAAAGRVAGLAAFVAVLAAGVLGPAAGAAEVGLDAVDASGPQEGRPNLAPLAVLVLAWSGLLIGSALAGNFWPAVSPFAALAALAAQGRSRASETHAGEWAAPLLLASFAWLQQAYHDPASPRATVTFLLGYTVATMAGVARWGRGWLAYGEGFAALGRLVAAVAPLAHGADGRLSWRPPLSGLAGIQVSAAGTAVLLIALGAMVFDALVYAPLWTQLAGSRAGWERTMVNTAGLVWVTATIAVVFVAGVRLSQRSAGRSATRSVAGYAAVLAPLVLGMAAAVEGAVAVFSGRLALAMASDPLGRGWDLFGTADHTVSLGILTSPAAVYLQAAMLMAAGVVAIVAAHDRALATATTVLTVSALLLVLTA